MPHAMRWQHAKIGLDVDYDHYRPKGENKTGEGGEKRQNFEENREDAKWRFMLRLPVIESFLLEPFVLLLPPLGIILLMKDVQGSN